MHRPLTTLSRLLLPLLLVVLAQPIPSALAAGHLTIAAGPADPTEKSLSSQAIVGYVYTFRPGDTLWDIAAAHGLSVEALIAANKLADPTLIHPGDWIFVPAERVAMPLRTPAPAPAKANPPPPEQPKPAPEPTKANPPAPEQPKPPPEALASQPAQDASAAAAPQAKSLPPEIAEWPAQILAMMNEKRTSKGLHPLTWSPEIAAAAQAHADDCKKRGWGSHVGSDGAVTRTRLARAGYSARWSGENWANAKNPQNAFAMWWNEPPGADPHRSNIMNPMYRETGIGIVSGPWGYYFFVDFGSR
jgi:uncharacterized protein YkwD